MRGKTWLGAFAIVAVTLSSYAAAGEAEDELNRLAKKAGEELTKRGEGTFFDTGYASYCRMNTGFDEGVFKEIGFAPSGKGYEFCYNVSDDRKKLALAATSGKDGSVKCLIIDATSGKPEPGKITDKSPCVPE